jgi:hypothetical protein
MPNTKDFWWGVSRTVAIFVISALAASNAKAETTWTAVNCAVNNPNKYDCEVLDAPKFSSRADCLEWLTGRDVPDVRLNKGRTYNDCLKD